MTVNSIWLELKGTTSLHRSILLKHRLKCGSKIEELSGENRKWIVRARVERRREYKPKHYQEVADGELYKTRFSRGSCKVVTVQSSFTGGDVVVKSNGTNMNSFRQIEQETCTLGSCVLYYHCLGALISVTLLTEIDSFRIHVCCKQYWALGVSAYHHVINRCLVFLIYQD